MNRQILQAFTEGKPLSITQYGITMGIAALAAAKGNLLISTDIVSRCISDFQKGRINATDVTDKEEKSKSVDCQFPIGKKEFVS